MLVDHCTPRQCDLIEKGQILELVGLASNLRLSLNSCMSYNKSLISSLSLRFFIEKMSTAASPLESG